VQQEDYGVLGELMAGPAGLAGRLDLQGG